MLKWSSARTGLGMRQYCPQHLILWIASILGKELQIVEALHLTSQHNSSQTSNPLQASPNNELQFGHTFGFAKENGLHIMIMEVILTFPWSHLSSSFGFAKESTLIYVSLAFMHAYALGTIYLSSCIGMIPPNSRICRWMKIEIII